MNSIRRAPEKEGRQRQGASYRNVGPIMVLVISLGASLGACSQPTWAPPPSSPVPILDSTKYTLSQIPYRTPSSPAEQPPQTQLRFMEPVANVKSQRGSPSRRQWREITSATRLDKLRRFADNQAARFALACYRQAWALNPPPQIDGPTLFIGLEPRGNFARVGFDLTTVSGKVLSLPEMPYLILDEQPRRFQVTLLHETAHVIHGLLIAAFNERVKPEPEHPIAVAPIPHSTAAITDRRTAFNEGWAIHFETVYAHCSNDPATSAFYQRRNLRYGPARDVAAEYYAALRDFLSYSQNFARYWAVRDGWYAFVAPPTDDYLRQQLDLARDLRTLRNANALMSSEGFIASVFFHMALPEGCQPFEQMASLYRPLFQTLRATETTRTVLDKAPLVDLIGALKSHDPALFKRAVFAFLDLSHGVTIDSRASTLWQRLFDAAISVDRPAFRKTSTLIEKRRRNWEQEALQDVAALTRRLGPVLVFEAPGKTVGVAVFGKKRPLSFDLNAVSSNVLQLVPGLNPRQVADIVTERARAPFKNAVDFATRTRKLRLPQGVLVARPNGIGSR